MRVGPMVTHPITSVAGAQACVHDGDMVMETSNEVYFIILCNKFSRGFWN